MSMDKRFHWLLVQSSDLNQLLNHLHMFMRHSCVHKLLFNIAIIFCRSGNSTQPIWKTYMYSTSSHSCYGTGNTCPSSTVTSCTHSEDVTVQCCKIMCTFTH